MSILKKLYVIIDSVRINLQGCRKLHKIHPSELNEGFRVTALHRCEFRQMISDYKKAFDSKILISFLIPCFLFCNKLCFVLRDENNKIMAYMFFLFNKQEYIYNYIHSKAIFVANGYLNTGMGALLENHVLEYLKFNTTLRGVRARVTLTNKNAYRLIKYNGFEIIEEYTDPIKKKKRIYIVKDFQRNGNK